MNKRILPSSFLCLALVAPAAHAFPLERPYVPLEKQPPIEKDGFSFLLDKCEKDQASVTCELTITNHRGERSLEMVWTDNSLTDEKNVKQNPKQVRFNDERGGTVWVKASPDAPVKAALMFPGVDPETTSLKRLDLDLFCKDPSGHRVQVEWRDIVLTPAG